MYRLSDDFDKVGNIFNIAINRKIAKFILIQWCVKPNFGIG